MSSRQRDTAVQRAVVDSDRPLIALHDGPRGGQWFWLDDWQRALLSNLRQFHAQLDHPALRVLHYRPTGERVLNRNAAYGSGEIWRYAPGSPWTREAATALVGADWAGFALRYGKTPVGSVSSLD